MIENDKELLNSEVFEAKMLQEITKEDSFKNIDKMAEKEIGNRVKMWRDIISKELAQDIASNVIENYLN